MIVLELRRLIIEELNRIEAFGKKAGAAAGVFNRTDEMVALSALDRQCYVRHLRTTPVAAVGSTTSHTRQYIDTFRIYVAVRSVKTSDLDLVGATGEAIELCEHIEETLFGNRLADTGLDAMTTGEISEHTLEAEYAVYKIDVQYKRRRTLQPLSGERCTLPILTSF